MATKTQETYGTVIRISVKECSEQYSGHLPQQLRLEGDPVRTPRGVSLGKRYSLVSPEGDVIVKLDCDQTEVGPRDQQELLAKWLEANGYRSSDQVDQEYSR